ncbi:hypothetical protein P154DRAFT_527622 [Amniculicola lignicola CBS 123094]|uniref:Uncharacterized protein n=1 Tax=Amniculicola lignicola CBS 123094 TaxID=1392246 RepID=A0A6A5VY45_9PLEO|nr:hypothetical protein P154DRAFT_527622 [Amniculicola lignicola CBS 123094]
MSSVTKDKINCEVISWPKKAAADKPNPIPLHNQIELPPHGTMLLTSAVFMNIHPSGDLRIWSASPIIITSEKSVRISSTSALGADFARGWHKLPDELKERILYFCTFLASPVDRFTAGRKLNAPYWEYSLLRYLRMTPEIATMAMNLFYKRNEFRLFPCRQTTSRGGMLYPKPHFNRIIRRVVLKIDSIQKAWDNVKKLASGHYGFENMRHVRIVVSAALYFRLPISAPDIPTRFSRWKTGAQSMMADGVTFRCEGELFCQPLGRVELQGLNMTQAEARQYELQVQELVESKVTFKHSGKLT